LVKSFEVPGFIKFEMQALEKKADEAAGAAEIAQGAAKSAAQKAELALANSSSDQPTQNQQALNADGQDLTWKALTERYTEIRKSVAEGPARTPMMTQVVSDMIRCAPLLTGYDAIVGLESEDPGTRLGAYIYLYSRPEPHFFEPLVSSVVDETDRPFSQFWGIQAVQRVYATLGRKRIPNIAYAALINLQDKLKPDSDRYYELSKMLSSIVPE
jgi:hypothetical protein